MVKKIDDILILLLLILVDLILVFILGLDNNNADVQGNYKGF
jgi:hypothetical protein